MLKNFLLQVKYFMFSTVLAIAITFLFLKIDTKHSYVIKIIISLYVSVIVILDCLKLTSSIKTFKKPRAFKYNVRCALNYYFQTFTRI